MANEGKNDAQSDTPLGYKSRQELMKVTLHEGIQRLFLSHKKLMSD